MSKIEEVSFALAEAAEDLIGKIPHGQIYDELAKAAIEAMRTTPSCINKINGSANWPDMIDAILQEPQS